MLVHGIGDYWRLIDGPWAGGIRQSVRREWRGRRYFAEAQCLSGDIGAKALIANYPDKVCEVPVEDAGVLVDADTPEALAALKEGD